MSSVSELKERIAWLERELPPNPPRFKVYDAMPFAILRYDPGQEWRQRRELRYLATRMSNQGVNVVEISLAEMLWRAIEVSEGIEMIAELERNRGFLAAQTQVNTYLVDNDFYPLVDELARRLQSYEPSSTVCFLLRAASLAPNIYPLSQLLEGMHGKTRVPVILPYPGQLEGSTRLRYMGLAERDSLRSYRVKIYG